jgi:hypothetical protein
MKNRETAFAISKPATDHVYNHLHEAYSTKRGADNKTDLKSIAWELLYRVSRRCLISLSPSSLSKERSTSSEMFSGTSVKLIPVATDPKRNQGHVAVSFQAL